MQENKHNETTENIEISEKDGKMILFATLGSLTELGGRVTRATSTATVANHRLARVGDIVSYEDGSEATIVDGAGAAAVNVDRSLALVGGHLSNGDKIVDTRQDRAWLFIRHGRIVAGLFDSTYVAPNYGEGAA